jgi:hypothetical protein
MSHLSRKHLLEFVEDPDGFRLAPDHRRHIDRCESCRQEAATLRAVLTAVRAEPAGEPSPLFWDHFAARVSEAVSHESAGPAEQAFGWRFGRQTAAWTAVALTIALGSTMVAWRTTLHAPTIATGAVGPDDISRIEDLDNDRAWKVVRAAADGLQWDDVQAAGISAAPGAAERVMLELSPEERDELARLLETEIKRSGA